MKTFIKKAIQVLDRKLSRRHWAKRTLVVGPEQPVDGDSVASTRALIHYLRKSGKEAYTLPTRSMFRTLDWILTEAELHPSMLSIVGPGLTCDNLEVAYQTLLLSWVPDEIVVVDGRPERIGFNPGAVPVYTIDHHGDEFRDDDEAYLKSAPSAGCLLMERFGIYEPILAVSILTDTYWLRQNQPARAARYLAALTEHGLTDELLEYYQARLIDHKEPRSLYALKNADIRFSEDGELAFAVLADADPVLHRAVSGQLTYYSRHSCTVRGDGYVSFRSSDPCVDLRPLARKYGKGGHPRQAAGQVDPGDRSCMERLFQDFIELVADDRKHCSLKIA